MPRAPVTVLVIDDSASNRRAIVEMLEAEPGITVLDRAVDGDEGLKKVEALKPDVVTLDLEMPRLDGFGFLRLNKARYGPKVLVISSYAHPNDVLKALELGAFDFVAKPMGASTTGLEAMRRELVEKIEAARPLQAKNTVTPRLDLEKARRPSSGPFPVIAVGASTGGPTAVQSLIAGLQGVKACVLVCQHMPPKVTAAFAQRLDGTGGFSVAEARVGDVLMPGKIFVAPGGMHLSVVNGSSAQTLVLMTQPAAAEDKYAPSIDRLFSSLAKECPTRTWGVVLTGMGHDGSRGLEALVHAGGEGWAEAEESAVVFGMPRAAIATGSVRVVLPIAQLAPALRQTVGMLYPHSIAG